MKYYKHYIGDYAAEAAYLSLVEDAIYTRLLRVYYRDEAPLPDDKASIAWLIGLRTRKEKEALERILSRFFTLDEDGWHNWRADKDIGDYYEGEVAELGRYVTLNVGSVLDTGREKFAAVANAGEVAA